MGKIYPDRNPAMQVSGYGPFKDIPLNVIHIISNAFNDPDISPYTPTDYVTYDFKKYGVRSLPAIHVWVEGLASDPNITGGMGGNKQRITEDFVAKVYYLYSDVMNENTSDVVSKVGYKLYEYLLQNSNLNDYVNKEGRVLAGYPVLELVKGLNIKMVDGFCIEILYSRTYKSEISQRT